MSEHFNDTTQLLTPILLMALAVTASNVLVQCPFGHFGLGDLLTWGAFTYPATFLITDLTNRRFGPAAARRVVYVGFAIAVVLSAALASPRIALASGTAFLVGQLVDVQIFHHLRRRAWWRAPLISSFAGSAVDTAIFFLLAFAGTGLGSVLLAGASVPLWTSWALGDFAVKIGCALLMLVPYFALKGRLRTA